LYLEATRTAAGPGRREASAWWTLAPHDISLALYLFDAVPLAITAAARIAPEGHDIATFATMHFPDGRLAHVHAARLAPQKERRFSLVGERRSLVFDELAPQEHLRYCEPSTEGEGAIVERIPVETAEPLLAQCASFVEGVARGDAAAGNAAHALSVVRVLAAGARSMSEGGVPVEVS
jgi:predicted dehydrogenase